MTPQTTTLLAQALQLPEVERAELTDLLLDSLDPPPDLDAVTDEQFAAELARRAAELRADSSAGMP